LSISTKFNIIDELQKLFRLSSIDKDSIDTHAEQEDLDQILQSSVPGLVSKSKRRSDAATVQGRSTHDGSATGHKLLAEPSVFNMSILLPPSLAFLQRLKNIVPPSSDIIISTLTSFLDDFLVNVFHPQLDETVTELCSQTLIELDAFQEDRQWSQHARKPIFKVRQSLSHRGLIAEIRRVPRHSLASSALSARCWILSRRIRLSLSSSSRRW